MVAQDLTGYAVDLDTSQLRSRTQALVRVWVSDGIHTASDQSNAVFTVPNHAPTVSIVEPKGNVSITADDTLALEAQEYDPDSGTVPDGQITWSSSIDGTLGTGKQLSIATLSVGTHTVMVTVNDGAGGIAVAALQVVVGAHVEIAPIYTTYLPFSPRL